MADNKRTRGRSASMASPAAGAGPLPLSQPALPASPAARPQAPPPPPPQAMDQTSTTEAKLDLIITRLDSLDDMKAAMIKQEGRHEEMRRDHNEGLARLTKLLEENRVAHNTDRRDLQITRRELVNVKEQYRRLELQVNDIVNHQRICNVRIDGKKEEAGENLKRFVVELSAAMGVGNMTQADVVTTYRMGKQPNNNARQRARTIFVTFVNQRARNAFYFARTKLKNQEMYRGVYINDDVTQTTRRQREDYRAVAALARQNGTEVRVHTDGLVLDGKKYLLTEPNTLPDQYSLNKAKTVEIGGEIYFSSEASFLSNFAPSPIVEGDIIYSTAEHMYQAYKCRQARAYDKLKDVIAAPTPLEAKRVAEAIQETPEWRKERDTVMRKVVSEKFDQNVELRDLLIKTGVKPLNEATHNDHFGIGVTIMAREIKDKSYRGANMLGIILAEKRAGILATVEAAKN